MENKYWTGRIGYAHQEIVEKGQNFWAAMIKGEWKLFPDTDDSFNFIWEESEADEFVRVRGLNQEDALAHAELAFQQWSADNREEDFILYSD